MLVELSTLYADTYVKFFLRTSHYVMFIFCTYFLTVLLRLVVCCLFRDYWKIAMDVKCWSLFSHMVGFHANFDTKKFNVESRNWRGSPQNQVTSKKEFWSFRKSCKIQDNGDKGVKNQKSFVKFIRNRLKLHFPTTKSSTHFDAPQK